MRAIAFALVMLLARSAIADGACDRTDTSCLIRQSLTLKYRVDALEEENALLRHENAQLQSRSGPGPKVVIVCMILGAVFFGSFYTASKVLR